MRDIIEAGNELFKRKQGVVNGLIGAKNGFLEAGKNLMVIRDRKLYRAEGNHILSFSHWAENEIGISRATAYQLILVYETFGDLLMHPDYVGVEYSKAALLLPLVTKDSTLQDKEELLLLAKDSSVRGLKDNILNHKGQKASDECSHEDFEVWSKCKKCKTFFR